MTTLSEALSSGVGTERQFNCPVHRDRNPSASVNVLKGVWYCYRCHARGRVDGSVFDDVNPALVISSIEEEPHQEYYPESWLDTFDAAGPGDYWLSRFEPDAAAHFRLGYDAIADAATYPLRAPSGRVLGVVRRPLADLTSRYRYPRGVKTSRLLFNYDAGARRRIVLTEGATDAIAAWEAGQHACATFSNRISAEQVRLLSRVDPDEVVLAFDNDPAGTAGITQAAAMLSGYRLLCADFGGAKDLADLSVPDRIISLEHAVAL